eukprot:CAMPEP_0171696876 /NCGR_PEP_ID=MMETSP0991-20121206/8520_1 /TAXON_ID=483369 /ORGANISM="non described non described, Strain CCMP2098" /LENGTH=638 /DNA_ID=CAMNT_0012285629 /DNA_START=153 /DNA_END=2069 /DNA_ORIENTATION=-
MLFAFLVNAKTTALSSVAPLNAYVHIPFCRRRCFYCDFPIVVAGDTPRKSAVEDYVECLTKEIDATAASGEGKRLGSAVADAGGLQTLYFGGGTPSLLDPHLLAAIVASMSRCFGGLAEGCEVTLEMDPGTFDAARLEAYIETAGVTRVSLGVQSWDSAVLHSAGRAHTVEDADAAVALVNAAYERGRDGSGGAAGKSGPGTRKGLRSWSLDLISGLPGEGAEGWAATLAKTALLKPPHVSVYDLQVEEGTAFGKWYTPGVFPLPCEDTSANLYSAASSTLRDSGYEHYEISSYALRVIGGGGAGVSAGSSAVLSETSLPPMPPLPPRDGRGQGQQSRASGGSVGSVSVGGGGGGFSLSVLAVPATPPSPHRSRHNSCYWSMRPFLGLGLGASSMLYGFDSSEGGGWDSCEAAATSSSASASSAAEVLKSSRRVARPRDLGGYKSWVDALHQSNPLQRAHILCGREIEEEEEEEEEEAQIPEKQNADESSSVSSSSQVRVASTTRTTRRRPAAVEAGLFDALLESVMVALRTADGLDLDKVASVFGRDAAAAILAAAQGPAIRSGLVAFGRPPQGEEGRSTDTTAAAAAAAAVADGEAGKKLQPEPHPSRCFGSMRLTDPEGFLLSNQIISTIFAALE